MRGAGAGGGGGGLTAAQFPEALKSRVAEGADAAGRIRADDTLGEALAYDPAQDREVAAVRARLHQHVQQMQTNTGALGDVPDAIRRGQAAVEEVLSRAGVGAVMGV